MENKYMLNRYRVPEGNKWVNWFAQSITEIMENGISITSHEWERTAYTSFYRRLSKTQQDTLRFPPVTEDTCWPSDRLIPVLGTKRNDLRPLAQHGTLLFLSVDSNGSLNNSTNDNDSNEKTISLCHTIASTVFNSFRALDPNVGYPRVKFYAGDSCDGTSMALSVIIASLCNILNIRWNDFVISTGSWTEKQCLEPVAADTLSDKIIAAARFGYKYFLTVEGQTATILSGNIVTPVECFELLKTDGVIPDDVSMEFISVSTAPIIAMFQIIRFSPDVSSRVSNNIANNIAQFLAVFDHCCFRAGLYDTYNKNQQHNIHDLLIPFTSDNAPPLVRYVAYDILRRAALHIGHSDEADLYRRPPLECRDYPEGWLGGYLKFEQPASNAVLDLDLGLWSDNCPSHQLTGRILDRFRGNIADHLAGLEDVRLALAIANTEARRQYFLGRLHGDENRLRRAWTLLNEYEMFWSDLFEYTAKHNLYGETISRQRNQCIECLNDVWNLNGTLPDWPGREHIEKYSSDFETISTLFRTQKDDALNDANGKNYPFSMFDLIAWMQWRNMTEQLPSDSEMDRLLQWVDVQYGYRGYPNYLPYECGLKYNMGNCRQKEHMAEQLRLASHWCDITSYNDTAKDGTSNNILTVLAMRTAAVLQEQEYTPNVIAKLLVPKTPLARLAEELLLKPNKIVTRCPY